MFSIWHVFPKKPFWWWIYCFCWTWRMSKLFTRIFLFFRRFIFIIFNYFRFLFNNNVVISATIIYNLFSICRYKFFPNYSSSISGRRIFWISIQHYCQWYNIIFSAWRYGRFSQRTTHEDWRPTSYLSIVGNISAHFGQLCKVIYIFFCL